jgi:hypothetical protein
MSSLRFDAEGPALREPTHRRLLTGSPLPARHGARHCAHPDCATRLSRYNLDPVCAVHGGWSAERAT